MAASVLNRTTPGLLKNILATRFEAIANAQFLNGSFVVTNGLPPDNGWNTLGKVDFTASANGLGGVATLQEDPTRQTRLNQVFMLKPTDRYLSFTLSGNALENMSGLPEDPFEVAMLDANTGVSLLGSDGLSHTDAFLNLHADGTESLAQEVTKVVNADGSITYRVDLSNISNALQAGGSTTSSSGSVGQAVNLSFDLIGFGKASPVLSGVEGSHINGRVQ
jgi:hypothetical protein